METSVSVVERFGGEKSISLVAGVLLSGVVHLILTLTQLRDWFLFIQ